MDRGTESESEYVDGLDLETESLPVSPTISGMEDDDSTQGKKITDEVILSVDDIVKYLKVNQASVYRWLSAGYLKGVRVGPRLWRIRQEDFKAFMDAGGVPVKEKDETAE